MQRTLRFVLVSLSSAVFGVAILGVASTGAAEETLVEGFGDPVRFAPMWPGGTVEQGGGAGLSWIRVVTDGEGGGSFVANVRPYRPRLDFSKRFVKLWIKVEDMANLGGMEFRLSSDRFSEDYFAFGFPLFDDEDFNVVRDGVWTQMTFSFGSARVEGEPDRSAINSIGWYVADRGGQAPVTAYWGGLASLPEPAQGVVSFTFDDGYDEHHLAAKMMAEHGFRGTAYIIPEAIGQNEYLSLHQLVDLQDRYGWDVAAHHKTPFTEMPPDELESQILGVQRFLALNRFGEGRAHLAYPLGKQNTALVRPLVRKHFTTARVAGSGPETLPPADPHLLRVMNVTDETSPKQVARAVRRAMEHKEWLILMFHYLVDEPAYSTQYALGDFAKVLREVHESGVAVRPLSEVWESCGRSAGGCELPADVHPVASPAP